jgi:hypothetical protein
MRPIPVVATAFILSVPGPGFPQEWIEFASREDRFTCNFPGQPRVTETTWRSELGTELPARVYRVDLGPSRYSVIVVDYNHSRRILSERARDCPAGAERCSGGDATGEGYWIHDVRGAMLYATWTFLQRDAKVTHLGYNFADRVEGHQLHLTNTADQSRTYASIYTHDNKLYVMEGTVPAGAPEPALFQQSLGWLDENGIGLRYESIYSNGYPPPPRVKRGPPEEGQGRIDAPGASPAPGRAR